MSSKLITRPSHRPLATSGFVAHVLLIEDDHSYADLVKILLSASEELRCEVSIRYTLSEGLAAMEAFDYAAVLLDLNLPDSRGLDTLYTLLSYQVDANVIVLTGSADRQQGVLAVGSGAQDYLVKGEFGDGQLARALRFSIERKQILKRLEEAQRIARIGHWECRPATDYFYASKEVYHFFGLAPEDVIFTYQNLLQSDCPMNPLLPPDILSEDPEQQTISQQLSINRKDGSMLYALLHCRIEITEDGDAAYFGTVQDITLQKQAEELRRTRDLAIETARVREQVVANVSHELRTPMNAIVGMTNILARTPLKPNQQECVDTVLDASQILLGIINDILLTSSLQNGSIQLAPAPFDLHLTLRRIADTLRPKAQAKGIALVVEEPNGSPLGSLIGDKQRLSQILYNLVGNAVKFTENGRVVLSTKHGRVNEDGKHWITISVADTGMGIPTDQQEEIFQAFTRAIPSGQTIEGTGLGLTITKQLVEQMNGQIALESELGKGTRFTVSLPFDQVETKVEQELPPSHPVKEQRQPRSLNRILVVEDHSINQLVIERTLQHQWPELEILVADSGQKAMTLLEEETVDLILMDLQMPGLDGYATSQLIRQELHEACRHVPIIAMTAHSQVMNDNKYLQSGMNDYVLKPFEPEHLFEKIIEHVS